VARYADVSGTGVSRRELLRRAGAVCALASTGALLDACGTSSVSAKPTATASGLSDIGQVASGKSIDRAVIGLTSSIQALDPRGASDPVTGTVMSCAYEGLVTIAPDGKAAPALASSFTQPDPTTHVYQLRPGVRFWDGSELTAEDVVASLQHLALPSSEFQRFYASVRSIEAVAPDRVVVRLSSPDPAFVFTPTAFAGAIVKKEFFSKYPNPPAPASAFPVGTGPFEVVSYSPENGVTLQRNEAYWGGVAPIKQLQMLFIVDDSTRLDALRTGQIDGSLPVPLDQAPEWTSLPNANVSWVHELRPGAFFFNVTKKPWSDIHVRRAVAHSIDRAGLVAGALRGYGHQLQVLTPPELWNSLQSPAATTALYNSLPSYEFSLAKAKAELAQSGFPKGFSADVVYPNGRDILGTASLSLSQNLGQLGIDLTVTEVPTETWEALTLGPKDKLGLTILNYGADYPDPQNFPAVFMASSEAKTNGLNLSSYRNPRVDALLAQQMATIDPQARVAALSQIHQIAGQDLPFAPFWDDNIGLALRKGLAYSGWTPWYYFGTWAARIGVAA
jgi:peptide/nickel transport system substrate-binding protein